MAPIDTSLQPPSGFSPADEAAWCHHRAKLALWDIPNLSRAALVEPHHVVIRNPDPILSCGALCAVDSQTAAFWSDLLIVTPGHAASRELFAESLRTARPGVVQVGLLPHLHDVISAAPLFLPEVDVDGPSQEPLAHAGAVAAGARRLPVQASMSHMVFYEKLNFHIYRCGVLGDQSIPAYLMSFGFSVHVFGLSTFPWFWWSYGYFTLSTLWAADREAMGDDSGAVQWVPVSMLAAGAMLAATAAVLKSRVLRRNKRAAAGVRWFARAGVGRFCGLAVILLIVWGAAVFAGNLFPYTIPFRLGWWLFILLDSVTVFCIARLIKSARQSKDNPHLFDPRLCRRTGVIACVMISSVVANRYGDASPHFIAKIALTMGGLAVVVVLQIRMLYEHCLLNPR